MEGDLREFHEMLDRLTETGNRAADAQDDLADSADREDRDGIVGTDGEGGGAEGPSAAGGGLGGFFGGVQVLPNATQQRRAASAGFDAAAQNFGGGAGFGNSVDGGLGALFNRGVNSNPLLSALAEGSGLNQGQRNRQQVAGRLDSQLRGLAEAGVEISDEQLSREESAELERVQRGSAFTARLNARASSLSNVAEGGAEGSAVQETNNLLKQILGSLNRTGGGGAF